MKYRLPIDLEVTQFTQQFPNRVRHELFAHFRKILRFHFAILGLPGTTTKLAGLFRFRFTLDLRSITGWMRPIATSRCWPFELQTNEQQTALAEQSRCTERGRATSITLIEYR